MGQRNEAYRVITKEDIALFEKGIHYEIYHKLGAHPGKAEGMDGVYFAVWAPHAEIVSVIGTFNEWDNQRDGMEEVHNSGIFTLFVPEARIGDLYKYYIVTPEGKELYKADPYANSGELRPGNASKIAGLGHYHWTDSS